MSVQLYEGNGGQQKMIKSYQVSDSTNIAEKVRPNDEARSLKLVNVPESMPFPPPRIFLH